MAPGDALGDVLHLLAHAIRATGDEAERTDKLEQRFTRVVMRAWREHWPAQRDRIVAVGDLVVPSAAEMQRALYEVGVSFADWFSDEDELVVSRVTARAFDLGRVTAVEEAVAAGAAPPDMSRRSAKREVGDDDFVSLWELELTGALDVVDERAAKALSKQSLFWVRDVWSEGLGKSIADQAMAVITAGDSRETVAKRLKAALKDFDEPVDYWRLVASSAVVRARSLGAVSGMRRARTETLRFVAVGGSEGDGKTSDICKSMHGTVFTMAQVSEWESRVLGATTPGELKAATPWVSAAQAEGKSPAQLARDGVVAPPLHGHCRSRLVAETFESFESIGDAIDAGTFVSEFSDLDGV
ncbi:MAG: hypothetical protein AB7U23_13160 [Dehalococcoidia bacterium]